ncbi:hypothetical protein [Bradyrhizobium sp. RD5-C2]|uniref:hypothetical protein n=1 Tax=Bradyrhizobium sp. RD5-C2 TaxID=244562 RepID=UPI001CC4001B|nr:hypothetical protein [Bradyrhizobium sp. RD5-C2]
MRIPPVCRCLDKGNDLDAVFLRRSIDVAVVLCPVALDGLLCVEIRAFGSTGQDDGLPEESKRQPWLQLRREIGAAGLIRYLPAVLRSATTAGELMGVQGHGQQ